MEEPLINKVAESGLLTIDLQQYFPERQAVGFDIEPFLFMGQLLREKDFREAMIRQDWTSYAGEHVAVFCSTDAILPAWAYMLIAANLSGIALSVQAASQEEATKNLFIQNIRTKLDGKSMEGKRVILKGCGDQEIGAFAYLEATNILAPFVKNLMYGEPCSTVPVFKKKTVGQPGL